MAKVKGTATATAKGNAAQVPATTQKNEVATVPQTAKLCQAVRQSEVTTLQKSTVFQAPINFQINDELAKHIAAITLPAAKISNDLTWLGHTSNQKNTLLDGMLFDVIATAKGKQVIDLKPFVNALITGSVNERGIKSVAIKAFRQRTLDHCTKKRSGNQWLGCTQWQRAKNAAMKAQRDKVKNINDIAYVAHVFGTELARLLAIKAENVA